MKLPHFFIQRPIFAGVISIIITLLGAISGLSLPIAQYPEIAPPRVVVNARYPGASAEEVMRTVATPLEQEINGVEDMIYMSSSSTGDGGVDIAITFKLGADLDNAQVLVQNRVAVAVNRLPQQVRDIGVTTNKTNPELLLVVHLISPDKKLDQRFIANYAILQLKDQLARLEGVGSIRIFGADEYAMRLWLDPQKMANYQISASQVIEAIRSQNLQVASGGLNLEPNSSMQEKSYAIRLQGRLTTPESFGQIVLKSTDDGQIVQLKDVAKIELGQQTYLTTSYLDDDPAVALVFFQQPGANSLETAQRIKKLMQELRTKFPPELDYKIVYNPTEYVETSIKKVMMTILEATLLVVLVIVAFLKRWRVAIIPIITIPVSLIGTFFIMSILGISVNTLSLLGLVLAIGIVVDDAIVVVENVERQLKMGIPIAKAPHVAMDEVTSALIASALVLLAVFIPTGFIGGITGAFYMQFAVTVACATLISALISLTLSPALCRLLLNHIDHSAATTPLQRISQGFFRAFDRGFNALRSRYVRIVSHSLRHAYLVLIAYACLIGLTAWQFFSVPTGFIPSLDQGYFIVSVELPPGASLDRSDAIVQKLAADFKTVKGVRNSVSFAGFSGATFSNSPSSATIFVPLEDFPTREKLGAEYETIYQQLLSIAGQETEAFVFVIKPPSVRGIGTGGGFKLMLQDRGNVGLATLEQSAWELIGAANNAPATRSVFTTFNSNFPEYFLDIDRVKAEKLNVAIQDVFTTLSLYMGSVFINDFNILGRTYRVSAQADSPYRDDPNDILQLKVLSQSNALVPIGSFATIKTDAAPYRMVRYNLYPAIEIQGDTQVGYSSDQALVSIETLAKNLLPYGLDFEWTELAYQEKQASNLGGILFALGVLFVFLVLAAQFESWRMPFAIILIVPMCILSALTGIQLAGFANDLLVQISLVVLIGLASKNAILIVQFAKLLENKGYTAAQAALKAARIRLRPIIMTSFAFILGVFPLVVSTGAGAELRQSLGAAVFAGMIGVLVFGLLFTPTFYYVLSQLQFRRQSVPQITYATPESL